MSDKPAGLPGPMPASVCYPGDPWCADESDDSVRFFRGNHQVFKAPKHGTPYAEYWPGPDTIRWMLEALNREERERPMKEVGNAL